MNSIIFLMICLSISHLLSKRKRGGSSRHYHLNATGTISTFTSRYKIIVLYLIRKSKRIRSTNCCIKFYSFGTKAFVTPFILYYASITPTFCNCFYCSSVAVIVPLSSTVIWNCFELPSVVEFRIMESCGGTGFKYDTSSPQSINEFSSIVIVKFIISWDSLLWLG